MSSGDPFARVERPKKTPRAVKPTERWGSDVIVDLLHRYSCPTPR